MNLADQIKLLDHKAEVELEIHRKKTEFPIPVITVANLQNEPKPILSKELLAQVKAGIASTKGAELWKAWGFRSSNSVLLFSGPSGTGKTTTAKYVARILRKPLVSVNAADIGSGDFGNSERNLKRIFAVSLSLGAIIFLDECDALLWDRGKATGDSMWMLGVINAILVEVEAYDGNVILASNHAHVLDTALKRRITFEVKFTLPDYETRKRLWINKWPTWPLRIKENEIEAFALARTTGAEIESAIKEEARYAIEEERNPTYKNLHRILERFQSDSD